MEFLNNGQLYVIFVFRYLHTPSIYIVYIKLKKICGTFSAGPSGAYVLGGPFLMRTR